MKSRVLFIDDEPRILESLKRSLLHREQDWSMSFTSNSFDALSAMQNEQFDAIVCDVRMLNLDGQLLLAQCREKQPEAVRIVLSSRSRHDAELEVGFFAHHHISKPFTTSDIEEIIERTFRLKHKLTDDAVAKLVGNAENLPAVPRIYLELTEALRDPYVDVDAIANIVSQDIALCARLLKVANSAYFGLRRQITNVRHAIVYLGMRIMRQLVFSVEVFSTFPVDFGVPEFTPESLQKHSLLTARIASDISHHDEHLSEYAFMAAMLHDLGKIVLACHAPDHLAPLLEKAKREKKPLYQIEEEEQVITHAQVGAYLIGHWGLPYPIAEAVAYHHDPWRTESEYFHLPALIYVANILAHGAHNQTLDEEYLKSLGVHSKIHTWQAIADKRISSFHTENM